MVVVAVVVVSRSWRAHTKVKVEAGTAWREARQSGGACTRETSRKGIMHVRVTCLEKCQ